MTKKYQLYDNILGGWITGSSSSQYTISFLSNAVTKEKAAPTLF